MDFLLKTTLTLCQVIILLYTMFSQHSASFLSSHGKYSDIFFLNMGTSGAVCKGMKSIQYSGAFAVMVATRRIGQWKWMQLWTFDNLTSYDLQNIKFNLNLIISSSLLSNFHMKQLHNDSHLIYHFIKFNLNLIISSSLLLNFSYEIIAQWFKSNLPFYQIQLETHNQLFIFNEPFGWNSCKIIH